MLTVNEIFYSLQGESTYAGLPCVFVRLTACHLRCAWCDSEYAFYEGMKMSIDDVLRHVESYRCKLVEITGGEPLLQKEVYPLMDRLLEQGYKVLIETSGSLSVKALDKRVIKIVDFKCPGSGEAHRNDYSNIEHLTPQDEVKFVIADRRDYLWAKETMRRFSLPEKVTVLFSPVHRKMDLEALAGWILEDNLPVRMQIQMHKVIWGERRGV